MSADCGFEALVADVVARIQDARGADVAGVLASIGRHFRAERVHFHRVRLDRLGWDRGQVFTDPGSSMGPPPPDGAPSSGPTWRQRRLLEGDVLRLDRVDAPPPDLPAETLQELRYHREAGVVAMLDVPVRDPRGCVVASLGLRRGEGAEPWADDDVRRLRLLGEILVPVLDAHASTAGADIAELRRAAERSERLEERLFAAMDVSNIGFFDWDIGSDRVWYLSPFAGRSPYPRDTFETAGADWFRATHPDDIERARARVDAAVEGRAEYFDITVRMRVPHYSADWTFVRSRGRVHGHDERGRARRIVGIYEDVSDAVRHAALERQREVALEHATRSAALGTLATSLAHELNQPLAALTSFVQAAARLLGGDDARRSEVQDALRRSVELAERASAIVRRMRRLAQHRSPRLEALDLRQVAEAALDLLHRDATASRVELRLAPAAGPVPVLGDRIQVEQVLVNLVRNAIEASALREDGRRVVTLETRRAGGRAEACVADSGPGIRADVLERLFEPFVTTKADGTGLGLTISRSIVEAHGGAIRVERTGPDGTRFVVTLPSREEEPDDEG